MQFGYTALHQAHPLVQQRVLTKNPVEYTNMTHPYTHCTLTQRHYRGHQCLPLSEPRRLGREEVGNKEMSGFSENNIPLVEPRDRDVARFATHYQNRWIFFVVDVCLFCCCFLLLYLLWGMVK